MAQKNKQGSREDGPVLGADQSRHPVEGPRPSEEEIRMRAYEIYIERGDLQGSEMEDWLCAERELRQMYLLRQGRNVTE